MKKLPVQPEILIVLLFLIIGLYPGHLVAASARSSGHSVREFLGIPQLTMNGKRNAESGWTVTHNENATSSDPVASAPVLAPISEQNETTPAGEGPYALNDQKNILIIGVKQDALGRTSLEGVWLAIQVPSSPRILFIPVYPTHTNPVADGDEPIDLAAIYGNRRELTPPAEFLTALEQAEIWWSYYIVLDQTVLGELNSLAGSPSGLDPAWANAEMYASLKEQFVFALSVCQNLDSVLAHRDRFAEYLLKMHGHYASNLEPTRLVDVFSSIFRYGDSLACEFPTLSPAALE